MTALAVVQEEMLAQILDDGLALPEGWDARRVAGLATYRNNYRTALVDALRSVFERTERLVGEASFARAAAHHLIVHPPFSWTLDLAGEGFDATCATLFTGDPDVAELAWLEWAMHRIFVARDARPIDLAGFAASTAGYGERDWAGLRLRFMPGIALRGVRYDLERLWSSLGDTDGRAAVALLDQPAHAVVWREGERPVFALLSGHEGAALAAMRDGASYGEACELLVETLGEEEAIAAAGAMLGRWLYEGLVEALG